MKTVGVDIAGAKNTWMAVIDLDSQANEFDEEYPKMQTLEEIVVYCLDPKNDVKNIVIDAPLSYAIDEENGMRDCELLLREALFCNGYKREYVASSNSLQGVAIRGYRLAEELRQRGFNGDILEIIPRYCLAQFATASGNSQLIQAIKSYKVLSKKDKQGNEIIDKSSVILKRKWIWDEWRSFYFGSRKDGFLLGKFEGSNQDGIIDAFICATIGYLLHNQPLSLRLVPHKPDHPEKRRGFVDGIHVLGEGHF